MSDPEQIILHAFLGSLVADAVAMPVHWYYDVHALDRDFPDLQGYASPKAEHPDSILWRSRYVAPNKDADILHDQAKYWGKRGVHYHQCLKAGENTLNFQLASTLFEQILEKGGYDAEVWVKHYVECLRTPGWHKDTYLEEYHRGFFEQRARGIDLLKCGVNDLHIGGLATVPALIAGLWITGTTDLDRILDTVSQHVALTHRHQETLQAAAGLARLLHALASGDTWTTSLAQHAERWANIPKLQTWTAFQDRQVVGRHLSPACYLPEAFTASLYLVHKYQDNFTGGILSNALCGGDNCHRGAVVGGLLGALNPVPRQWLHGLHRVPSGVQERLPSEQS